MRRPGDKREQRVFTSAEALEIRRDVRQRGMSQAAAARKWGCSSKTIYECVTRMTYKEVGDDFYWKFWECAPGFGPSWLKERMDANDAKKQRDWLAGKQRRKPREGV